MSFGVMQIPSYRALWDYMIFIKPKSAFDSLNVKRIEDDCQIHHEQKHSVSTGLTASQGQAGTAKKKKATGRKALYLPTEITSVE